MMARERMICADCGEEMNHHANKLDYGDDSTMSDAALGGVLKEVHTCPACGLTASRIA